MINRTYGKRLHSWLFSSAVLLCCLLLLGGCQPAYKRAVEAGPVTQTMEVDAPYNLDFAQIQNDLVTDYGEDPSFGFIKTLELDGDNERREMKLSFEVVEGASPDAIDIFTAIMLRAIADGANTQDARLALSSDTDFGGVYRLYSITVSVTQNGETSDTQIQAGDAFPYDPAAKVPEN